MAKGKKRRQRQGVEDLSNYARKAGQCRIKFEDEAFTAAFSQTHDRRANHIRSKTRRSGWSEAHLSQKQQASLLARYLRRRQPAIEEGVRLYT
jgi:hypothetical protein